MCKNSPGLQKDPDCKSGMARAMLDQRIWRSKNGCNAHFCFVDDDLVVV